MKTLLNHMWTDDHKYTDICVIAMLLRTGIYAGIDQKDVSSMLDYLISNQLPDGGFNCDSIKRKVKSSSIHTTLSVLEALSSLKRSSYQFDHFLIRQIEFEAKEFLLRKQLIRRERDRSIIKSYITQFHYPFRWQYDVLKALVFFATDGAPLNMRMNEALNLLESRFSDGKISKGQMFAGLNHFKLEDENRSRVLTYYGLVVLKYYDKPKFIRIISQ